MLVKEHPIPYQAEVVRKALHLIALVIPAGLMLLGRETGLALLAPVAILALTTDVLRTRSAFVARWVKVIFGFMMRQEELPPVGGPVRVNGATWVLLNATLLTLVFPLEIAVLAFTMVMLSDAGAALVGRKLGRNRWPGTTRTVEGSSAFVVVGLLVCLILPLVPFKYGAVAVFVAAVLEIPDWPVNDNIRVPFGAATVMFLLERFVAGNPILLFT